MVKIKAGEKLTAGVIDGEAPELGHQQRGSPVVLEVR
jgi:hypothetical protein